MMYADCAALRRHIPAFVDGELRGPKVLTLLQHLEYCSDCTAEVEGLRTLGDQLRVEAPADPDPKIFAGLASTVVSRTRAEDAESWLGFVRRAREDWHWLLVGAGSVASAFVSTTILSVLLAYGTKPERSDSLSALTYPQAGAVLAMPVSDVNQSSVLMQVDDLGPLGSRASEEMEFIKGPTEADLVNALLEIVTYKGRAVAYDSLSPKEKRNVEKLFTEISRLRSVNPIPVSTAINVRQIRFDVLTSVSARGL